MKTGTADSKCILKQKVKVEIISYINKRCIDFLQALVSIISKHTADFSRYFKVKIYHGSWTMMPENISCKCLGSCSLGIWVRENRRWVTLTAKRLMCPEYLVKSKCHYSFSKQLMEFTCCNFQLNVHVLYTYLENKEM